MAEQWAVLEITDGTDTCDLLYGPWRLVNWRPQIADYKDGGVFGDSPFAEGRRLLDARFQNVTEAMELIARAGSQDALIYEAQKLRRLLEKARLYWSTKWQNAPVWIEARAKKETNSRYAILHKGRLPEDSNPYSTPFASQLSQAVMNGLILGIEREHWMSKKPGLSDCVQVSALQDYYQKEQDGFTTLASADDAHDDGAAITIAGISLIMGNIGGAGYTTGVRFRNVTIPQGETIIYAFVLFEAGATRAATTVNLTIQGEDTDDAAAFSTHANFTGRTRTTASVAWNGIGTWTLGQFYESPGITTIIQEIVDRAGWASGNDLVVFFANNASSANAYREAVAHDDPTENAPILYIVTEDSVYSFGAEASCSQQAFVANKHNKAQLTDIYHYDSSTGLFSTNLLGETLPYAFLPTGPNTNDIVYYGCQTGIPDSGPFCSLVHDIGTALTVCTVTWQYWNGAWVAFGAGTLTDNTSGFTQTGVHSVHWATPADWVTTAVNGVTGYWVRAIMTGGPGVAPTQQNRQIYTVVTPFVEIASAQVGGDIAALARLSLLNSSYGASGATALNVGEVICGLRSISRGSNFTPFINLSDEQNPTGITVTASGASGGAFATDVQSPTGRVLEWTPTGVEAITARGSFVIASNLLSEYFGTFHVFIRCRQLAGSAGDIGVRFRISKSGSSGVAYTSETKYTTLVSTVNLDVLDFGLLTLPVISTLAGATWGDITFAIDCSCSNAAAPHLKLIEFILMPVDEWAIDCLDPNNLNSFGANYLEIDGITYPKSKRVAFTTSVAGAIETNWKAITNGPPVLQANAQQRLWFFQKRYSSVWLSNFELCDIVQAYKSQRYLSMRGNR